MLFFFARASKTYRAIQVLWKAEFYEDAYALARTIYELRLQAIYMSLDADARSRLFLVHWLKVGFGTLQLLERQGRPDWKDGLKQGLEDIQFAAKSFNASDVLEDPKAAERAIKQKWWGSGGIRAILKELNIEQEYDFIYSSLSDYSHSGPSLLHMFVTSSDTGDIGILLRPTKAANLTVPWSMTDWLSQIICLTGRACNLDFDAAVQTAQASAKALLLSTRHPEDRKD
jgi:hypothetical protein